MPYSANQAAARRRSRRRDHRTGQMAATTWSSASTFQPPPSYQGEDSSVNIGGDLTFVDFLPECRDPGGLFSRPEFDNFRTLIDRANTWLQSHPRWKVQTCESVEFKTKGDEVDNQKMTYLEYGESATCYIRGLRLWLVPRSNSEDSPQQIGFLNMVPQKTGEEGFFGMPSFETLDEVLSRFNSMSRTNPVPGRILTVESQEMKLNKLAELDPDRSYWVEEGDSNKHFLFVIRVFFEIASLFVEEIGVKDFIPKTISEAGIFTLPKYEPFSSVVEHASKWCAKQEGVRFCNAQSVEVKIKTGYEIDTKRMNYTEHGGKATLYSRILRVAYAKPASSRDEQNYPKVRQLTCKTFVPVQLSSGIFVPEFEALDKTRKRVEAWIKATGARVISAETAAMRLMTGGEAKAGVEASFTFNQSERDEYWIFVIRLYLNGFYHEPPSEELPPVPEIEETDCCIIL